MTLQAKEREELELLEPEGGNVTEQLEGLDADEDDMLKVVHPDYHIRL